jgi:DNA processing protein
MGEVVFAPFAPRAAHGPAQRTGPRAPVLEAAIPPKRPAPLPERERLWRRLWIDAPGIGWLRLQQLHNHFGSLERAWVASPDELCQALAGSRWGSKGLEALLAYRQPLGAAPISASPSPAERQRWRGQRCLVWGDAALPASLQALDRPPLQLHWQGRGSLWACLRQRQAVAVVGTRHPSRHGESMAREIGRALAEAGWPVVSGLAEGIDAAAHEGCLEAGGSPVGVLGTPLERVYPRHHGPLQRRVATRGLLITELAPGTAVRAGHFAARNRLQVALAKAVVLVECPLQSGALHSAEMAWAEGTPLWAVPADTTRASAAGSNRWLGQGATALLNPSDLIASLGPGPLRQQRAEATDPGGGLRQREALLLAAVGPGASLEQLCWRLRQGPEQLGQRLLKLELAGLLRSEPGLWWRPC